ncbi:hypothetical protein [Anoxybacteroides tepidamans]|uniref:hypothetical protein n=1 Tax=Anoxybacteroides tepidamans TaxID=265948 RepID=UPI000488BC3E|nr:hypothetical protein [Anoxybacillus tepidamans]
MLTKSQFLKFWFEGSEGYVEFKFINEEGVKGQRFIDVVDINEGLLQRFIDKGTTEKLNVYFSVATRKARGLGEEEHVLDVPGLWVDIDQKHASFSEAMKKVFELPTPPSTIVSSGKGIHAYFKFMNPFRITDDESFDKIRVLSAQMHKYLNADNTSDLARVLRLPESLNFKYTEEGDLCEIIEHSGSLYSLDDFQYLADVKVEIKTRTKRTIVVNNYKQVSLDELRVPKHIIRLIQEGGEKHTRSEKIFGVTWAMLEAGHTPEEIAFVLTNPDWGISEKILERPPQHQLPYIENAINKALQRIEENNKCATNNEIISEITEKGGCYYHGEKRLSNFVFVPYERVFVGKDEILKGVIQVNDGTTFSVHLNYKSLISKKDLLTAINSSRISWLGGDKEIQYLREHLLTKDVTEKTGVSKIGLHEDLFITLHQTINHKGIVDDAKKVFIPKFINSITDLEQSVNIQCKDGWVETAREVISLLPKINTNEVIYPIIGWHMLCPIAPLVRKDADGGFPQLMMWGTKGSGKTSTAQLFGKLFGNPEIRSCSRPPFSIMREMDTLNAIPLYLDEYRPQHMAKDYINQIKSFALLAYKASYDSRGKQDQSTVDYQYTAPVVWIGETPFTEPNLLERVVMAKLSPNTLLSCSEYKNYYKKLSQLDLTSFLGGYIQWLLQKKQQEELKLREWLEDMRSLVDGMYPNLPERVVINISLVLTGMVLFEKLAGELGVEIAPVPYIKVLQSQVEHLTGEEARGSLDRIMEHTATLTREPYFEYGRDYIYNPSTGELILATESWFASLRKFCREYGYQDDNINNTQIRNFLKENCEMEGYVKEPYGARRTLEKQQRCTIIDAYMLEQQLGISVSTWALPQKP